MNNLHFVHKLYKILMFSNNLSILLFLIILSSEFVQGSKVHKLKEFTFKFFILYYPLHGTSFIYLLQVRE